MNQTPVQPRLIAKLETVMKRVPRAVRVRTVPGLVCLSRSGKASRRYVIRSPGEPVGLLVADHFDLWVDAAIWDGELGTLGLVHFLPSEAAEKDWLRQRIDHAAYARHLFVGDLRPGTPNAGRVPFAIEVVFVVPDQESVVSGQEAEKEAGEAVGRLGDALREIVREAGYLHGIGVNLWRAAKGGRLEDGTAPRRAFAWLLTEAEAWYGEATGGASETEGVTAFDRLELHQFRIPGRRRWRLAPEQRLHLVHGHNGSGKSSFSEAVELAMTGRVERLGTADHETVLTNQEARLRQIPAQVVLGGTGGPDRVFEVTSTGAANPLKPGLPPASFRMHQGLSDQLSQSEPSARARLFLEAFFPSERSELERRDQAWNRARGVFDKLPPRLRTTVADTAGGLNARAAVTSLAWLKDAMVPWEKVTALLPLSAEQLAGLLPMMARRFVEAFQRTGPVPVALVESIGPILTQGLRGLLGSLERRLELLNQAIALLEEYGMASVSARETDEEDLAGLANRWLSLQALADLLQREDQILATIETAREAGQVFVGSRTPVLARVEKPPSPEDRRRVLADVQAERDEFRVRVAKFMGQAEREAVARKPLRPLGEFSPAALDELASWGVFGEAWRSPSPPLAEAVQRAFSNRKPTEVRAGETLRRVVGEHGWGKEWLEQAVRLRGALQQVASLQQDLQDPAWEFADVWSNLRQLREAVEELAGIDESLLVRFTNQVGDGGPLSRAVNEVMALLTPARWAYSEVVTRAEFRAGQTSLDLQTPDRVPLQLRLNTAELNTFALTLFLLLARRLANPLRLIVLDDPLQNMDELTITTVARGLNRLLRLWARLDGQAHPWRLVLLLHGEQSVERFRDEAPCATYLLPWLSPQEVEGDALMDIVALPSLLKSGLQDLSTILAGVPPARRTGVGE